MILPRVAPAFSDCNPRAADETVRTSSRSTVREALDPPSRKAVPADRPTSVRRIGPARPVRKAPAYVGLTRVSAIGSAFADGASAGQADERKHDWTHKRKYQSDQQASVYTPPLYDQC